MDGICKILDGGLASQLVANGYSSIDSDPLWSARLLHTNPAAIQSEPFNVLLSHTPFKVSHTAIQTESFQ